MSCREGSVESPEQQPPGEFRSEAHVSVRECSDAYVSSRLAHSSTRHHRNAPLSADEAEQCF